MIPLAKVAGAKWAAVARAATCLYSDVDDTLTVQGKLSAEAYHALTELRAAGLRIVLVTGRPLGWAEVLASIFPIDAAVAENGAVAALPGGRRLYFDEDAVRLAGAERRVEAAALVRAALPDVHPASDQPLRDVDLAYDIAETVRHSDATIARLAAILDGAGLNVTRSSIHMHGTYSAADKGKMAALVARELWGDAPALVAARDLFVGDSPNDAPAFKFFRHSIGVANVLAHEHALRSLDALPWAVTTEKSGLGFAELAAAILPHRHCL